MSDNIALAILGGSGLYNMAGLTNIEEHDLNVKLKKIKEFLGDACRVKIVVRFHGRENAHQDLGARLLEDILCEIKDLAVIESQLASERREIFVIVRSRDEQKSQ